MSDEANLFRLAEDGRWVTEHAYAKLLSEWEADLRSLNGPAPLVLASLEVVEALKVAAGNLPRRTPLRL